MTAATPLPSTPTDALRLVPQASHAGILLVSFAQVRKSGLNPRTHFDQAALIELAVSIYEQTQFDNSGNVLQTGIQQNLIGRPAEGDTVEIAAGERRYRAVELLVGGLTAQVQIGTDDNGRPVMGDRFLQVSADYPLPFLLKALSDAELIELATLENIQRQDMTPMEEADAFSALVSHGRSPDYIATRYGMHPATVKSRLELAAGLGKEGRKLLDKGEITLEHAKIIASSSGALKKSLTEQARSGASVTTLRNLVKSGAFLVDNAIFDVPASKLTIDEGLLTGTPPKFADHKAALSAQIAALDSVKAEHAALQDDEGQAVYEAVLVVPVEDAYASLPSGEWVEDYRRPEGVKPSYLFVVSTTTGKVREYDGVARVRDVKEYERQQQEAAKAQGNSTYTVKTASGSSTTKSTDETGTGIRDKAHEIGHQTRAQVTDAYLATHPQVCLALACHALYQEVRHYGTQDLLLVKVQYHQPAPLTPESLALRDEVACLFPELFTTENDVVQLAKGHGLDVLGILTAESVTPAALLKLFALLTHQSLGKYEQVRQRPSRLLVDFATRFELGADLVNRFDLTAEFLEAYKSADLVALIGAMPTKAQPAYKHNASKKDLIGAIIEKKAALKEAGWVPDIVKFQR